MSPAGRFLAAQQERRRKRLFISDLLVAKQERQVEPEAERSSCQIDKGEQPREEQTKEERHADASERSGSRTPIPARPSPSQQHALAMLRRLHPTATHLAAQAQPAMPGNSRRLEPRPGAAVPSISRRWRKSLPRAFQPQRLQPQTHQLQENAPAGPSAVQASGIDGRGHTSLPAGQCAPKRTDAVAHDPKQKSDSAARTQEEFFLHSLTTVAHAVWAAQPRLCGSQVYRATLEAQDRSLEAAFSKALGEQWPVLLQLLDQHRRGAANGAGAGASGGHRDAAGGDGRGGGGCHLFRQRTVDLARRLEKTNFEDMRRMKSQLVRRGWRSVGEAEAGVKALQLPPLLELMQQLLTRPRKEAAAAAPRERGPPGADLCMRAWAWLADAARAQAATAAPLKCGAIGGSGGGGCSMVEEGGGDLLLLRSAVLGLVLLEGCSEEAEAGPLGTPEPLACALLPCVFQYLTWSGRALADAGRMRLFAPSLLYDVLAVAPVASGIDLLPRSGEPQPPPPKAAAPRLTEQHLVSLLHGMYGAAKCHLAEAALARALKARSPPDVIASCAQDVLATSVYMQAPEAFGREAAAAQRPPSGAPPAARGGASSRASGAGSCGVGGGVGGAGRAGAGSTAAGSAVQQHRCAVVAAEDSEGSFASVSEGRRGGSHSDGDDDDQAFVDAPEAASDFVSQRCSSGTGDGGGAGPPNCVPVAGFTSQLAIYDCLYMAASEWHPRYDAHHYFYPSPGPGAGPGASPGSPINRREEVLQTLTEHGLLDVQYDRTEVRRLRSVLADAAAAGEALCGASLGAAGPGQGRWEDEGEEEWWETEPGVLLADAEAYHTQRRVQHDSVWSQWAFHTRAATGTLSQLLTGPALTAVEAADVAETFRPGLLRAHPGTWAALVAKAAEAERRSEAKAEAEAKRLRVVLRAALLGLTALGGQEFPLEHMRLAYCAMAGLCFEAFQEGGEGLAGHTPSGLFAGGICEAVELFRFLTFVPCPLTVPPERGWTSAGIRPPAAALAAGDAANARADPRVRSRLGTLLRHSVERFDLVPGLAGMLTAAVRSTELLEEYEEALIQRSRGGDLVKLRDTRELAVKYVCIMAYAERSAREEFLGEAVDDDDDDDDEEEEGGELQGVSPGAASQTSALARAQAPPVRPQGGSDSSAGSDPRVITQPSTSAHAAALPPARLQPQHPEQQGRHRLQGPAQEPEGDGRGGRNGYRGVHGSAVPAATGSSEHLQLGPRSSPTEVVAALRRLVSCCRWTGTKADATAAEAMVAAALPPPAPSFLLLVAADQMLLASLFLALARPGHKPKGYWHIVFEPMASEAMAATVLGLPAHAQVPLFPPLPGEPGVVQLSGVQPALLPHSSMPEYAHAYEWSAVEAAGGGIVVSATSRWSDQLKAVMTALVKRRLGAMWIQAEGPEGVQRALLLAAKVRDEMLNLSQRAATIYASWTRVIWPNEDGADGAATRRDSTRRSGGGGDKHAAAPAQSVADAAKQKLRELVDYVVALQEEVYELGRSMREECRDGAAAVVRELQREVAEAGGGRLRDNVRLELRLQECECGRPDRPRLPLGGQATDRRRLKDALLRRG